MKFNQSNSHQTLQGYFVCISHCTKSWLGVGTGCVDIALNISGHEVAVLRKVKHMIFLPIEDPQLFSIEGI